ncbi:hypothetical protein I4U23_010111 [Adineta vaga]|nr:hypothetical protein I4U23_010111 [Adineta vaga]
MSNEHLEYLLILFAFITQTKMEDIQLFQMILTKLDSRNQQVIPEFLDDEKRPSFVNRYSRLLCLSDGINRKYPNLSEHLIKHQHEWKEYLVSTINLNVVNKYPF